MAKVKKEKTVVVTDELTGNNELVNVLDSFTVETPEEPKEIIPELPKEQVFKAVVPEKPAYRKELDVNLPKAERIMAFVNSRNISGVIRLNDFLKSLYPLPTPSQPPAYLQQGESKALKGILDKLQESGQLKFVNDQYKKLGSFYYVGTEHIQQHYNLTNVNIEAML